MIERRPEARALHCVRCGGAIAIATIDAATVVCPFCNAPQRVPSSILDELARYRAGLDAERGRIAEADRARSTWERWSGGRGGRSPRAGLYFMLAVIFVVVPLLGLGIQALLTSGVMTARDTVYFGPGILGFVVVCYLGYVVWFYGGKRRHQRTPSALAEEIACPSCGASHALSAGQVGERCRHCNAPMFPSPTMIAHALDAARDAARRASMERYRAERNAIRALRAMSAPSLVIWISLGMMGIPLLIGTAALTITKLTDDRPLQADGALSLGSMWALSIALVAVVMLVVRHRRRTAARFQTALEGLARELGGRTLDGVDGTVQWLNAFWCAPYEATQLMVGRCYGAATATSRGFPVLVEVDPIPIASSTYVARVSIHLAAEFSSPYAPQGPLCDELARAGFVVERNGAGLVARASDLCVRSLRKTPESITGLVRVVTSLTALAEAMRGSPARPFPVA